MPPEESRGRLRSVASLASETSLGPVGYSKRYRKNAINASPRSRERQDLYFTQLVCLLVSYRPLARYQPAVMGLALYLSFTLPFPRIYFASSISITK